MRETLLEDTISGMHMAWAMRKETDMFALRKIDVAISYISKRDVDRVWDAVFRIAIMM